MQPFQFYRNSHFIGGELTGYGPRRNVFTAMRALTEGRNIVYLPDDAYSFSGIQKEDPQIISQPYGRTLNIFSISSHKERLSFHILAEKEVKVINREQSTTTDASVFRAYHIIRDSRLHIAKLHCNLDARTFRLLQNARAIQKHIVYEPQKVYVVSLQDFPLVSRAWANPRVLKLVPLLQEEQELIAERTALKEWRKVLADLGKSYTGPRAHRNDSQSLFSQKEQHGRPIYKGTSTRITGTPEAYIAKHVQVLLASYTPKQYTNPQFTDIQAIGRLWEIKKRLSRIRFIYRTIIFAMEYTASDLIVWDAGIISPRGLRKRVQYGWLDDVQLKRITWEKEVEKTS
ncbi:MAG: hypothetical protein CL685_02810 [Candidatus Magasanikbacteria bacterium]|nr:hypothetical protein [Candidatus Magasanikbacteria bacterium]|tara:strand:+ start:875 stop:1906 length:1032 start_codon:yes stop_codon:yes gene_type:complete